MAKTRDTKKENKKKPQKTLKEKRLEKKAAAERTEMTSGPVTVSTRGGDWQLSRQRSAYELASPCQMTLTAPIVTSTGSRVSTRRAISTRTP
mgnify:CR=1 FL=1